MIQISEEDIINLGADYGLTNDIIGYEDFERLLIQFGTKIYVQGFNDGHQSAIDHMFLSTCDCWEV